MHCPSRRPSLDISIHPRFGDTGLTPPLLIPKRVAIFFIEQNQPSERSNRHRSRLVWVKRKNSHSTLSCDYFNCHNCYSSTGHLWNRNKIYSRLSQAWRGALESSPFRLSSSPDPPFDDSLSTAAPDHPRLVDPSDDASNTERSGPLMPFRKK